MRRLDTSWLGCVIALLNAHAIIQESVFRIWASIFVDETLNALVCYLHSAMRQATVERNDGIGWRNELLWVSDEICLNAGREYAVVSDPQIFNFVR